MRDLEVEKATENVRVFLLTLPLLKLCTLKTHPPGWT